MSSLVKHSASPLFKSWSALDRLFAENFFDGFKSNDFVVDISEDAENIKVKAELPGVKKEDLSVDCQDGVLTIKAERKEESEENTDRYIRKESYHGVVQRSFSIGAINPDSISASYKDGILTVTLKKEVEPTKRIEIQ